MLFIYIPRPPKGFKFQPRGLFLVVKGLKFQTLGGFRYIRNIHVAIWVVPPRDRGSRIHGWPGNKHFRLSALTNCKAAVLSVRGRWVRNWLMIWNQSPYISLFINTPQGYTYARWTHVHLLKQYETITWIMTPCSYNISTSNITIPQSRTSLHSVINQPSQATNQRSLGILGWLCICFNGPWPLDQQRTAHDSIPLVVNRWGSAFASSNIFNSWQHCWTFPLTFPAKTLPKTCTVYREDIWNIYN